MITVIHDEKGTFLKLDTLIETFQDIAFEYATNGESEFADSILEIVETLRTTEVTMYECVGMLKSIGNEIEGERYE